MWIIFFILVGVFVVAAMAVTFLALMKEPHSEELAADLPKSLHESIQPKSNVTPSGRSKR